MNYIDNEVWCECGHCWKDKTQAEADATCPDRYQEEEPQVSDVLTEMQEYSDIDPEEMAESAYCDPEALAVTSEAMREARDAAIAKQTALAAEMALLRHLALEGELSLRRDQLQAEHAAVSQRLAQARQMRQGLVEAVTQAGGKLPSWEG